MATDTKSTSTKSTARRKKPTKKKGSEATETPSSTGFTHLFMREAGGLFLLVFSIAIFLALISFSMEDFARIGTPLALSNMIGPVGAYVAHAILYVFGIGAFLINGVMVYIAISLILAKSIRWQLVEIAGQILFVVFFAILSHLIFQQHRVLGHLSGGIIGEVGGTFANAFFGYIGAILLSFAGVIVALMLSTPLSLSQIGRWLAAKCVHAKEFVIHKYQVHQAYKEQLAEERLKYRDAEFVQAKVEAKNVAELERRPIVEERNRYDDVFEQEVESKLKGAMSRLLGTFRDRGECPEERPVKSSKKEIIEEVTSETKRSKKDLSVRRDFALESMDNDRPWTMGGETGEIVCSMSREIDRAGVSEIVLFEEPADVKVEKGEVARLDIDFGPQIVDNAAERAAKRRELLMADSEGQGVLYKPHKAGVFELPPVSFLNFDEQKEPAVDAGALRTMASQIEQCLADFKVDGSVVEICPGPVITMFEFSPAPGVRVSKIANLSDDLAMALSALSVRIVAPIPGKGVVGIEVPNPRREMVFLKEIIADDVFSKNQKADLPLALGVDVEGGGVVADLARMPHLLVAGATGSGKSVAVNTMICSLLYRHTPEDVRFIMVDPKMLEFSVYADIPHLLLPVVTDPKQATVALNWAVNEMERRYQALADLGVRNIKGYNKRVKVLSAQAEIDMTEGREDTEALRALGLDAQGNPEHIHMPYIVVIIDEFADLMMTAAKDVETAVARLAQKARAAGIHLILATQRPSTDVITGLIKANFPTRFALRVTSKTDSRVILDGNGAENLLGHGDALFVPPGTSTLTRVHGGYVSEEEISKIVDFLKAQGKPEYNEAILIEEGEEEDVIEDWERDEHYEAAVALVIESQQASISMIQRKLRVGYNRAARMVDMMERENIVSSADGCKPREVLMTSSPY